MACFVSSKQTISAYKICCLSGQLAAFWRSTRVSPGTCPIFHECCSGSAYCPFTRLPSYVLTDDSPIYLTMGLSNRNASICKIKDCISHIIGCTPTTSCFATHPRPKLSTFLQSFLTPTPSPP